MSHKEFSCPKCASTHIRLESTASWSIEKQEWVCDDDETTSDRLYCTDCGEDFNKPVIILSPD